MNRPWLLLLASLFVACGDTATNLILPLLPATAAENCAESGCSSERPFCETSGRCVACRTLEDCTDVGALVCDAEQGQCVQCLSDEYCGPGEKCSRQLGRCIQPCTSNADCPQVGLGTCNLSLFACLQCNIDSDCGGSSPCDRGECSSTVSVGTPAGGSP